jgi:uncharacterized protein (TIGR02757 family)
MRGGSADRSFLTNHPLSRIRRSAASRAQLRAGLDRLYAGYNRDNSAADPIQIVRRYPETADREIVGFCAAGLAFGRVRSVLASLESLLALMEPSPFRFIRTFDPIIERRRLRGLGHRWVRDVDIVALLWILRQMVDRNGSIEGFFAEGIDDSATPVVHALESFCVRAMALDVSRAYGRVPRAPGVRYFFPRPSTGSACKRLNLFLRWMVRRDELDPGGWSSLTPSALIVPLDVHVMRVGRCLGLTPYRSPGWRMAASITDSLRDLDASDPVRYDFAICHLGMAGACGFERREKDSQCPLRGLCQPISRRRRSLRLISQS